MEAMGSKIRKYGRRKKEIEFCFFLFLLPFSIDREFDVVTRKFRFDKEAETTKNNAQVPFSMACKPTFSFSIFAPFWNSRQKANST